MTTLETLRANLSTLSAKDQEFARSLISQADAKGLSDKQQHWVGVLADRSTGKGTPKAVQVGDMTGVVSLLSKASAKLASAAIVIGYGADDEVKAGKALRLNVAKAGTRVPGSVNVVDVESRVWFGRILPDGTFQPSPRDEAPAGLADVLAAFAKDPVAEAGKHAHLTGKCCFCNTKLSAGESTSVGYGPTCAKKFGLPWGAR